MHDGQLIYSAFTSLDGYVADETGNFDWAELGEPWKELAYVFVSVDQLLDDFEHDVQNWSSQ